MSEYDRGHTVADVLNRMYMASFLPRVRGIAERAECDADALAGLLRQWTPGGPYPPEDAASRLRSHTLRGAAPGSMIQVRVRREARAHYRTRAAVLEWTGGRRRHQCPALAAIVGLSWTSGDSGRS